MERYKTLGYVDYDQRAVFPFLGSLSSPLLVPKIGNRVALIITFALLVWQGLGAGFTANAWQIYQQGHSQRRTGNIFRGTDFSFQFTWRVSAHPGRELAWSRIKQNYGFQLCFWLAFHCFILSFWLGF